MSQRGLLLASNERYSPTLYLTSHHRFTYTVVAILRSSMQGLEGMCSGQAITKNLIAMLRGRKPKKGPVYDFSPTIFLMTLSRSIA